MRILLTKLDNDRHALEIVRADGSRERAELETKSLLVHDFVHLAVEAEAGVQEGFWGLMAAGKTFAEMNDRTGAGVAEYAGSMAVIEMLVGALSGALSGVPHDATVANIRDYLASVGKETDFPAWLTPEFVVRVEERLRRLKGHWNGTPFGDTMEVVWEES